MFNKYFWETYLAGSGAKMVSFFEKIFQATCLKNMRIPYVIYIAHIVPTSGHGRRLNEWERAIAFAKEKRYETAEFLFNKNGYAVYEPVMKVGEISYIGPPHVILVKGDKVRMTEYPECFDYIRDEE